MSKLYFSGYDRQTGEEIEIYSNIIKQLFCNHKYYRIRPELKDGRQLDCIICSNCGKKLNQENILPKNKEYNYKRTMLYRSGLNIEPSKNFVEKFIEIYNDLLIEKNITKKRLIDEDTAKYMINSIFECIISALDFGFDIWINRVVVFVQRVYDRYVYKSDKKRCEIVEDIKQVTIRPISSLDKKIKNKANEDNKEYQEYIIRKKNNHNKIKEYYKEFYSDVEKDW